MLNAIRRFLFNVFLVGIQAPILVLGTVVLIVMLAVFLPWCAFAQDPAAGVGMSWNGIPLGPILALLGTIVTGLLGWLATRVSGWAKTQQQQSAATAALARLATVGMAMLGDLWASFDAEFQKRFADGKIDAEDREAFRKLIDQAIDKYTSRAELEKVAQAAGLPVAGAIAWLAEWAIDRLMQARDPRNAAVPAGAYPGVAATVPADDPSRGSG